MTEKTVKASINPFQSNVTFLYPLKTSEKLQGLQKCDIGLKWVNVSKYLHEMPMFAFTKEKYLHEIAMFTFIKLFFPGISNLGAQIRYA